MTLCSCKTHCAIAKKVLWCFLLCRFSGCLKVTLVLKCCGIAWVLDLEFMTVKLGPHPHEARAYPLRSFFFFSSRRPKNYLRSHETTKTDSKRYSVYAKSVCGAVILPQRYT